MSGNGAFCVQRAVCTVRVDELYEEISQPVRGAGLSSSGFGAVYVILLITLYERIGMTRRIASEMILKISDPFKPMLKRIRS